MIMLLLFGGIMMGNSLGVVDSGFVGVRLWFGRGLGHESSKWAVR